MIAHSRPALIAAALATVAVFAVAKEAKSQEPIFAQEFAAEDFNDGLVEVHDRLIMLNETILFFFDEARIKSESFSLLNKLADTLKSQPGIQEVLIAGHTDSVGSERYNLELSRKRADAVMEYLVAHGIAPLRLRTTALGENSPRVPNTTQANRQINRRVEFQLTKTEADRRRAGAGVDVVHLSGSSTLLAAASERRTLTVRERLRSGVVLETGSDAAVILRLPDLSVLKVGPSTRIKLARIGLGADGRLDASVKLICGTVTVFNRPSTRAVVFTPSASIIGEGATFTVEHGENGRLLSRVLAGSVDVSAGGTASTLESGYANVISADGDIGMPTPLLAAPAVSGGRYPGDAAVEPQWRPVPGAAVYAVTFSSDPRQLRVISVATTEGESQTPPNEGVVWWSVEAVDSLGVAGFGSTLHTLVPDAAPDKGALPLHH